MGCLQEGQTENEDKRILFSVIHSSLKRKNQNENTVTTKSQFYVVYQLLGSFTASFQDTLNLKTTNIGAQEGLPQFRIIDILLKLFYVVQGLLS